MTRLFAALIAALFIAPFAFAQSADDVVWIQVEAQPNLAAATDRARAYSANLEDVNGFALGGSWYGIAVGPYRRDDAELLLRRYRRDGVIPRDSFIQLSERFQQQFWPVGDNVLETGVIDAPVSVDGGEPEEAAAGSTTPDVTTTPLDATTTEGGSEGGTEGETEVAEAEAEAETAPAPTPPEPDETPAEARRSERALSAQERKDLQIALQWAGFYDAAIDGAFGRGTRASMGAWQAANGYDQTGVLTTRQRAALIAQYNACLLYTSDAADE